MEKYVVILNNNVLVSVDDFLIVLAKEDGKVYIDYPKVGEFDKTDSKYWFDWEELDSIDGRYKIFAEKVIEESH